MGAYVPGSQTRQCYPPKMAPLKIFGIKSGKNSENQSGEFRQFSFSIVSPLLVKNRDKYGLWQKSSV